MRLTEQGLIGIDAQEANQEIDALSEEFQAEIRKELNDMFGKARDFIDSLLLLKSLKTIIGTNALSTFKSIQEL